jgi:hypothetical protein
MRQESSISNNLLQALIFIILALAVGIIMYMKHVAQTDPVSEPATIFLVGSGLAGFRRKFKM